MSQNNNGDHTNQALELSTAVPTHADGPFPNHNKGGHIEEQRTESKMISGDVNGKKIISARKVEANRQNSRKSTGPRTAAGKKKVSRNAIRHGFFSKWLLVQHPDAKESPEEYEEFYADIRAHYQPADWLEHLWVEKIAVCAWRLRRLIRGESGQIARALAEHSHALRQPRPDILTETESAPLNDPEMDAMTDHLFLPEKEELDKILRCEAMINRELNHAMAELERLQARRKGGNDRGIDSTKQSQEGL
jgi:hypothetical protein